MSDVKRWTFIFYFVDKDKHLGHTSRMTTKPMTKVDFKKRLGEWIEKENPSFVSVETRGYYRDEIR